MHLLLLLLAIASSAFPAFAAEVASPPEPTASAVYAAPADHPHVGDRPLTLPAPPPAFSVHDGGWIRFAYPPGTRERIQPLIHEADAMRRDLTSRLVQPVLGAVHVHVARTPGEMTTLAPEGAPYPRYASGVAYSQIGLVLLTLAPEHANSRHDLVEVFKHELAHVALYDAVGQRQVLPRWFNEGFAVHASGESSLSRLETLWTATLAGTLMPLSRLEAGFPADETRAALAYAQSADLVRFLMRQSDQERFAALVARLRRGQAFDESMRDAYGLDRSSLEYEWREDVARRYSFWPVFFSGTAVWFGVLGLFLLGWRRKKHRAQATLARWSREEALDLARRERPRPVETPPPTTEAPARVHIVFPVAGVTELARSSDAPRAREAEVPKVEHDGDWHTLH